MLPVPVYFFRKKNIKSFWGEMKKTGLIVIIAFFVSCVPTKYNIRRDSKIEALSVCIYYAHDVPENVKARFNQKASDYVTNYNQEQHEFRLSLCGDSAHSAFKIYIAGTQFVSAGKQALFSAIVIPYTILGILCLLIRVPLLLHPAIDAKDESKAYLVLTDDITSDPSANSKVIRNSGYLRNQNRQAKKHGIAFYKFLDREIREIEKQYKERNSL
jgi:hypothetical protein